MSRFIEIYEGYEIKEEYVKLAKRRIREFLIKHKSSKLFEFAGRDK
ncbi:MAG: hypothetical protein N2V73_00315 [Candidatus Methanospirare jalkutatii]|nr:hypothetical protein [Candidatus Methanospirare jalkutatii]